MPGPSLLLWMGAALLPWLLATSAAWGQLHFAGARPPESAQGPVLEQILDDAEWEPLAELPVDSAFRVASRPVGRLVVRMGLPGGGVADASCTAVLVSVDIALTAHHCVPGRYGVRALSATLELGAPGEGARFAVEIAPVEAAAKLDYSLLRVESRPGERFGWARLATRPARQGAALFVVHFPRGRAPMLTRRNCSVHRSTITDFLHSCDTARGSSGAPLFTLADAAVVGLHTAGSRQANYGKQAAALLTASPALTALAGVEGFAVARVESAPSGEDAGLAAEGERLVARQMREALAALAAVAGQHAAPTDTTRHQAPGTTKPEPYLRWDGQPERPGPPQ